MNGSGDIEGYVHGHHESVLRSHTWRTAANSAAYLLPHLAPDRRILDVGCGPGSLTADIAANAPGCEMHGIDASAEVIAKAAADHPGISFATGDIYAIDAPDDHFDIVHAHQVLQHLDDPVAALREMRRVTKPGGVVAIRDADYAGMTWSPESTPMNRWMEIYQAMTAHQGHDANAGRRLLGWARSVGFADDDIEATASIWCFADQDTRSWWSGIWADRVVESGYKDHAIDRGLADIAELEEIAAAWRTWAAAPDAVFFVPHGEVIARA
ncbi:MAG: methyltransferase domain-containing protein [Acidimicrobiales bacterium]